MNGAANRRDWPGADLGSHFETGRRLAAILRALAPHAAARLDIVAALRELDDEAARPEPVLIEAKPNRPEPFLIDVVPSCPVPMP